jgi:hypothetical protein
MAVPSHEDAGAAVYENRSGRHPPAARLFYLCKKIGQIEDGLV